MPPNDQEPKKRPPRPRHIVSARLSDDTLIETVLQPTEGRTVFCVFRDGKVSYEPTVKDKAEVLVPYSAHNNLLTNGVVKLPSQVEDCGSVEALVAEVTEYIHRYVDVSPLFEQIAAYYVLLTWVYDDFNELPYLRLIGDPGSGKTRFLLTVGSICYKPIFASGASSVSPLFRILDVFQGTLIIDEGDFRQSDEQAEIVKILNNGNARGFPVLRSEVNSKGEYNPTAFRVFGPKIVATRRYFQDWALESRCLTEEMGQRKLRQDVPINLPATHAIQAQRLRNKLLKFRFDNLGKRAITDTALDPEIEPRLNQVFAPLLAMVEDDTTRTELRDLARSYHRELLADRGQAPEAQVLEILRDMQAQGTGRLVVRDVANWFADRYGDDYERKVTAKWIGWIIRKRLRLKTQKSHGVFVVADGEAGKIGRLFERYGLSGNEPLPSPEPGPPPRLQMTS